MARTELIAQLNNQLRKVNKAMLTATAAEMQMLHSIKNEIEQRLLTLRVGDFQQPRAA